jgi:hypothetical protein
MWLRLPVIGSTYDFYSPELGKVEQVHASSPEEADFLFAGEHDCTVSEWKLRKCSDIPDQLFLAAVRMTEHLEGGYWRDRGAVRETLEAAIGPVPEKLFLAKARTLGKKGKLEGCTDCTCRGDYHLPWECDEKGCC